MYPSDASAAVGPPSEIDCNVREFAVSMIVIDVALGRTIAVAVAASVLMSACSDDAGSVVTQNETYPKVPASASAEAQTPTDAAIPRWYTAEHVAQGQQVYEANCATCHGSDAEGVTHWRERDASGNLPPPPLDGTAHAWHHPIPVLVNQIKNGTPAGLGTMPGFGEQLSDDDIGGVIAWIQSKWPDEIYTTWLDINRRAQSQNQ